MHKLSSLMLQTGRFVMNLIVHFIAAIRKGKKAPSALSSCSSSNPPGEYLYRVICSGLPQLSCGSIYVALVQHISFYLHELLSAWLWQSWRVGYGVSTKYWHTHSTACVLVHGEL